MATTGESPATNLGIIRTLVVEDDFRVAKLHSAYVEMTGGFTVVAQAATGDAAFRLVLEHRPDLVLLDLYLPDIEGLIVLRKLRLIDAPRPDVIVVTAAKDSVSVKEAMQSGALHYLTKPFEPKELTERLKAYRHLRTELANRSEIDQELIDRLWSYVRTSPERDLPKGHSPHTLELVVSALRATDRELTADEVSKVTGISKTSSQRYLSYLARISKVSVTMRYGAAGRPEHRYRWI